MPALLDEIDFAVDNGLPPQEEGDDCMATNQQRFEGIEERLDRMEAIVASGPTGPPPPGPLRRLLKKALEHKGTTITLSIILCAVSVFGGGEFKYWLDHREDGLTRSIDDRLNAGLNKEGGINQTLAAVKGTTDRMDGTLKALQPFIQDMVQHQFETASKLTAKEVEHRLSAISDLVVVARDQNVKVDPAAVKNTGDKLLQVSASNSTAWNVALTMVDYRSNLNDASVPPRDSFYPFGPANAPCCKPVPGIEETYYDFPVITGKERPQFTTSIKRVSIANSARIEKIGHPVPQSAHNGPESLLGHGGEIALDGYYLRNIVLDGMTVHYNGGPIFLDDVIFNNCRFVFDNVPTGRRLGSRILSASSVTFHTPSA